ncbi:hypothetical protein N7499_009049 [Penicillium canescens]|uniref:Uncharacterized protein n=1 Tax=Penicillium canescens TaxID=5083 RepID=A0AAD6NF51_PENCN|nr:uncharacterized protein N7446_008928 [Penicillium canescens]KAJ6058029.1 hypothetical protein N7460_001303 [Penicillium canescens]KAJ6059345.1 hypothetical protein N7446_008928 [Penicillium canescens]KAJ6071035.1 hypothetical protein N7499_009049 [Penicillium canescens]KAJ6169719.1 hypothetical protein N7485_007065 [Penicillium canescens]
MEGFNDEQFQRLLDGLNQAPNVDPFDLFCDTTLIPQSDNNNGLDGLLSFPPLPPISEVPVPALSDVPPREYDSSGASIRTSEPERGEPDMTEALEVAKQAQRLVEAHRAQQEAMKLE